MLIKKIYPITIILTFLAVFCCLIPIIFTTPSYAAKPPKAQDVNTSKCKVNGLTIPNCTKDDGKCTDKKSKVEGCLENNPIIVWVGFLINVVASVIGVGAVAMLVFAGVQYAAAGDKPDQVEAAKKKIGAVVIGLVAFIFLYAFLNWLIPGGVFK